MSNKLDAYAAFIDMMGFADSLEDLPPEDHDGLLLLFEVD